MKRKEARAPASNPRPSKRSLRPGEALFWPGTAGVTSDTALERTYRHARFARIYDGPDEVHILSVARRLLKEYASGGSWDFGLR